MGSELLTSAVLESNHSQIFFSAQEKFLRIFPRQARVTWNANMRMKSEICSSATNRWHEEGRGLESSLDSEMMQWKLLPQTRVKPLNHTLSYITLIEILHEGLATWA